MHDQFVKQFFDDYIIKGALSSPDPYDVWTSCFGIYLKNRYYRNKYLYLVPVIIYFFTFRCLEVFRIRLVKSRIEPAAAAYATLISNRLFEIYGDPVYKDFSLNTLQWLQENTGQSATGQGWGLAFEHTVSGELTYPKNFPLLTITPYVVYAAIDYKNKVDENYCLKWLTNVSRFLYNDISNMNDDEYSVAKSYSGLKDRVVINASSYYLLCSALLKKYDLAQESIYRNDDDKVKNFLVSQQRKNGSWPYSNLKKTFIDCFHSCIVVRNMILYYKLKNLPIEENIIELGYAYIKSEFYIPKKRIVRRFSEGKSNLGFLDIYDTAELILLSKMMKDRDFAESLMIDSQQIFIGRDKCIYSKVFKFCNMYLRLRRNNFRWAALPYLHALIYKE